MERMGLNEIREKFLEFFESKEHLCRLFPLDLLHLYQPFLFCLINSQTIRWAK